MFYLEWDDFDSMENRHPECIESEKLTSMTFDDAFEEARQKFALKRKWKSAYSVVEYPRNPRLMVKL